MFTFVILVLHILWRWLIVLLIFGPPAYFGVVVAHFAGVLTHDIGVGILVAVVATGLLSELARVAVRMAYSSAAGVWGRLNGDDGDLSSSPKVQRRNSFAATKLGSRARTSKD